MRKISNTFLFSFLFFFSFHSFADGVSKKVEFVGYDWIDADGLSPYDSHELIRDNHPTNMNVVRTPSSLNEDYCANNRCAIAISSGEPLAAVSAGRLDICPNPNPNNKSYIHDWNQCKNIIWGRVWDAVESIIQAKHAPRAIYFIDEPEDNVTLSEKGSYKKWKYASLVCTLREAIASKSQTYNNYKLANTKVFTILSWKVGNSHPIMEELKNQMNVFGCTSGVSSKPDWIGFNKYNLDSHHVLYAKYNSTFPVIENGQLTDYPKWILVPPSTQWDGIKPSPLKTDYDLNGQIKHYKNFLHFYSHLVDTPVVGVMFFKFDPVIYQSTQFPNSRNSLIHIANDIL